MANDLMQIWLRETLNYVLCQTAVCGECRTTKRSVGAKYVKWAPKCVNECNGVLPRNCPMKTRPDGSAFRRSNIACGRQPSQPRPRNDGFHWATPRHP